MAEKKKLLYVVEAEVCLGSASYGKFGTYYKYAYSAAQAVKLVALDLETKYRTRVYLKNCEVERVERKTTPIRNQIPIKTGFDILTQYELDVTLEKENGCRDLELLREIIVTGVNKAGFSISIRELVEEGNWEKVAKIIQQDPNFGLEPEPLLPLLESVQ